MKSDVKPGMKVIDGRYGLPSLPKAEFTLISRAGEMTPAAQESAGLLQSTLQTARQTKSAHSE
jgi:hypothetical protein